MYTKVKAFIDNLLRKLDKNYYIIFIEKRFKKIDKFFLEYGFMILFVFLSIFYVLFISYDIYRLINNIPESSWSVFGFVSKKHLWYFGKDIVYPLKNIIYFWVFILCILMFLFLRLNYRVHFTNNYTFFTWGWLFIIFCWMVLYYYKILNIIDILEVYNLKDFINNSGILYESDNFIIINIVKSTDALNVVMYINEVHFDGVSSDIPLNEYNWVANHCHTYKLAYEYVEDLRQRLLKKKMNQDLECSWVKKIIRYIISFFK